MSTVITREQVLDWIGTEPVEVGRYMPGRALTLRLDDDGSARLEVWDAFANLADAPIATLPVTIGSVV